MRSFFLLILLLAVGCDESNSQLEQHASALTGGNPHHGRLAIELYGCASCHTIPGIPGADAMVGPPLNGVAQRTYLAGILPNTPENLVRWIENPPAVDPRTGMPNLHLNETDARDIASYLY